MRRETRRRMLWWAGWPVVAGVAVLVAVLVACGGAGGGGAADGGPGTSSGSRSPAPSGGGVPRTSTGPSVSASARPPGGTPSVSAGNSAAPAGSCAAGHAVVTVSPGAAAGRRLCVRPGTVISLVLRPRADDKRWVAVRSSAPVFVLASGWRLDTDGTAHATLRCAGTRGGTAEVGALAKTPDVAGAARVAFTLRVRVVPYRTQG